MEKRPSIPLDKDHESSVSSPVVPLRKGAYTTDPILPEPVLEYGKSDIQKPKQLTDKCTEVPKMYFNFNPDSSKSDIENKRDIVKSSGPVAPKIKNHLTIAGS